MSPIAVREDRDKHTERLRQQILQVAHAAAVKVKSLLDLQPASAILRGQQTRHLHNSGAFFSFLSALKGRFQSAVRCSGDTP
jgi:hypothetical protein